jgi:hypothetical protein
VTTEQDRQEERDRLGNDPSAPPTEQLEDENPLESPAEAEDPDAEAHERQERDEEPERPLDAAPSEERPTPTTTGAQPEQPADDQQAG